LAMSLALVSFSVSVLPACFSRWSVDLNAALSFRGRLPWLM
jgi:hypothetical protein